MAAFRFRVSLLILTAAIAPISFAATPDYSGTYASVPSKKSKNPVSISLRVVQTDKWVEIVRTAGDKVITGRCGFAGSQGPYINGEGNHGSCTAELKRGTLLVVSISPEVIHQRGVTQIRIRRRQEWKLSADRKSLTISFVEDSPDAQQTPMTSGLDSASVPARPTDPTEAPAFWMLGSSWKETYQRTE